MKNQPPKKGIPYLYALIFLFGLFMTSEMNAQKNTTVTGIVKDEAGLSLPGVNIVEKGTSNSTSTDFDGKFSIKLTTDNAVLTASFVSFTTKNISVAGKTSLIIQLNSEEQTLKEVVVVGYGTVKKSDVTGAISTIKPETITERNAINPLEAIQGSTPGVQITSSTGRSGDGYNVVIRGKNSLLNETNGGTNSGPLYVVDGVPTDNIDFLNPQDIARMDVLKDASSAAIYGSRGASGVIIIATKSGTTAKSGINVSLESSYGTKTAVRLPTMMTGAEWWAFHQAAYLNANPATMTPAQLATAVMGNPNQNQVLLDRANSGYNYDWQGAILKPGMTANNYINLSGRGDNGLAYNLAFGIQNDKGLIDKDSMDKYTFKLGLNHKINDKFSTGANVTIARVEAELGSDVAMSNAFRLSPLMSPWAVDANGKEIIGTMFWQPGKLTYPNGSFAVNKTSTVNPFFEIDNSSQTEKSWQTIGNVYFQYQALNWLSFKTTFAAGIFNGVNSTAYGAQTEAGVTLTNKNSASVKNLQNFNYTWDNQIDIKHTFNEDHAVSALLLQSFYSNVDENQYMYSNNQPFDVGSNNMGSGVQTSYQITSGYAKNTLNSYAARVNYGYKDKYLLTAS
ncbi:SusC/RagA family TonB-linked outer membrane protein, partial [Flavobacterium sp.]|uniref:SusC/RagA family TonB-linked outer membrane protein n=1 Tax=Flavobacterium sp. TaxID=239 RepID=UPI002C6AD868